MEALFFFPDYTFSFFFYCFGAELEQNVSHLFQFLLSRSDFDIFKLRMRRCDWSDSFSVVSDANWQVRLSNNNAERERENSLV